MSVWWPLQDGEIYVVAGKPAEHWVMELVGTFSGLQDSIRNLVWVYLSQTSPKLADAIDKKHLKRLSDKDRWDYVKVLAEDVGYKGDRLPSASQAFWRCKAVRDFVSHRRGQMTLVLSPDGTSYHYQSSESSSNKYLPDPLTPEVFRGLSAECRWLQALVNHLAFVGGIDFLGALFRRTPEGDLELPHLEILEPPPLPIEPDWDGSDLQRTLNNRSK